jgi:maspardin
MEGTVEYANFRAWVARRVLPVGTLNPQEWVFYEWGARQYQEPLVCLHGVVGSADSFFLQVLALAERGYRVLSVQLPVYWSVAEFCDGFQTFLDMVHVRRVHLYGAGLGGFLAMQYASRRPERVASIALTHAFLSTDTLSQRAIYSPSILRWLPDVLVRSAVRSLFPKGRAELPIAEAAEFSIVNTMAASRDELASRLSLLGTSSTVVGRVRIPEESITVIDVFEFASCPGSMVQEELQTALPNARRAMIKAGGDFPYLGAPDDVTLHLVVHLRRNAAPPVEPAPLPPPAKPRPVTYVHRVLPENNPKDPGESPTSDAPDFRALAEERITAVEQKRMDKYAFELQQIRKYIVDCEFPFIVAVLEDCEGSVDRAVQRIRDGQYKKNFHLKARKKAVRRLTEEIKKEHEEEQALLSANDSNLVVPAEDAMAASAAVAAVAQASDTDLTRQQRTHSPVLDKGSPGSICESPEIVSKLSTSHDIPIAAESGSWIGDTGQSVLSNVLGRMMSGGLETVSLLDESQGTPGHDEEAAGDDAEGELLSSPKDATPQGRTSSRFGSSGAVERKEKPSKKSAGKRPPRTLSSKGLYPAETDSVTAYVTSEKVGMRAHDNHVGRGPAPFPSSGKPEGGFIQAANGSGWSQGSLRSNVGHPARGDASVHNHDDRTGDGSSSEDVPGVESLGLADERISRTAPSKESFKAYRSTQAKGKPGRFASDDMETVPEQSTPMRSDAQDTEKVPIRRASKANEYDAWSEFRREEGFKSREEPPPHGPSTPLHEDDSDEDSARLREWMMSAQSAKEFAQRK